MKGTGWWGEVGSLMNQSEMTRWMLGTIHGSGEVRERG